MLLNIIPTDIVEAGLRSESVLLHVYNLGENVKRLNRVARCVASFHTSRNVRVARLQNEIASEHFNLTRKNGLKTAKNRSEK